MRIKFYCKIEGCTTMEEVKNLIKVEGIGWDEMSSASLSHNYDDKEYVMWNTFWSNFNYLIHPNWGKDGEFEVTYKGSLRGFLAQNLIPRFIEVRIEEMVGKLGRTHNMAGKETQIYERFHKPAIEKLRKYMQSILPEKAAESLMSLSSDNIGEDLLKAAGLVHVQIGGWAWWSQCCMTTMYSGWVIKETADEWEIIKILKEDDKKLPDMKGRASSQKRLWNWIGVVVKE